MCRTPNIREMRSGLRYVRTLVQVFTDIGSNPLWTSLSVKDNKPNAVSAVGIFYTTMVIPRCLQ